MTPVFLCICDVCEQYQLNSQNEVVITIMVKLCRLEILLFYLSGTFPKVLILYIDIVVVLLLVVDGSTEIVTPVGWVN